MNSESHVLPDVLQVGLKAVIVGTAVGDTSKIHGAYYANPSNHFWRRLAMTGLTPKLRPEEYPALLTFGLGLSDLNKTQASSTNDGLTYDLSGFETRIGPYAPAWIVFNSKRAAGSYLGVSDRHVHRGQQDWLIGNSRVFVVPGSSNNWDARVIDGRMTLDWWQAMARDESAS